MKNLLGRILRNIYIHSTYNKSRPMMNQSITGCVKTRSRESKLNTAGALETWTLMKELKTRFLRILIRGTRAQQNILVVFQIISILNLFNNLHKTNMLIYRITLKCKGILKSMTMIWSESQLELLPHRCLKTISIKGFHRNNCNKITIQYRGKPLTITRGHHQLFKLPSLKIQLSHSSNFNKNKEIQAFKTLR